MAAILCRNLTELNNAHTQFPGKPIISIGSRNKNNGDYHAGHQHVINEAKKIDSNGIIQVMVASHDFLESIYNTSHSSSFETPDINYMYNWLNQQGVDIICILDYDAMSEMFSYSDINDLKQYAENIVAAEGYTHHSEFVMESLKCIIMANKVTWDNNLIPTYAHKVFSDKEAYYARMYRHFYTKYITPVHGTEFHLIPALEDEYSMPYSSSWSYLTWSEEDKQIIRSAIPAVKAVSFDPANKQQFIDTVEALVIDTRQDKQVWVRKVDIFDDPEILQGKTLIEYRLTFGTAGRGDIRIYDEF